MLEAWRIRITKGVEKEAVMERKYEVVKPGGGKTGVKKVGEVVQKTVTIILYSLLSVFLFGFAAGTVFVAFKEGGTTIGIGLAGVYSLLMFYWIATRNNPVHNRITYAELMNSNPVIYNPACSGNEANIFHNKDDDE